MDVSQAVEYRLTGSEMNLAAIAGVQRALDAVRRGRKGRYGAENGAGFDYDVCGCIGELAVAKHLNRYWNGNFLDLDAADVDRDYQVRASLFDGPRCGMFLHSPDKDHQPFIGCFVRLPSVWVMGWVFGREGKLDPYWRADLKRPAFVVPYPDLHPISSLVV